MSSNQIGGFFNRLEASRKYLFGSVGVLGAANSSVISGAFILRGLEHEPVVNVAPDWESYNYTKLDISKDADKAFFEAALAWDLELDGKKWADGKNVSLMLWLVVHLLIKMWLVQVNDNVEVLFVSVLPYHSSFFTCKCTTRSMIAWI